MCLTDWSGCRAASRPEGKSFNMQELGVITTHGREMRHVQYHCARQVLLNQKYPCYSFS